MCSQTLANLKCLKLKLNGYFLELHKIILFYEIFFIVSSKEGTQNSVTRAVINLEWP